MNVMAASSPSLGRGLLVRFRLVLMRTIVIHVLESLESTKLYWNHATWTGRYQPYGWIIVLKTLERQGTSLVNLWSLFRDKDTW